jgi:hypothetical protein
MERRGRRRYLFWLTAVGAWPVLDLRPFATSFLVANNK